MSRINLDPPLKPRDGKTLRGLEIDRISTTNQDPKSNADQRANNVRWIEDRYDEAVDWSRVTGQGSGETIDRDQVREAEDLIATGQFDFVIMEDLGRHLRRAQAIDFCELCEDMGTRLIAINDGIDTAKDWRLHAFFAAMKHEQANKDTSERIKRTLRNRFTQGEVLQFTVYGYIKPPGAKHDSELQKDPAAEPIYDEWFRMLENGATYSDVADWLNRQGVPTGPYSRLDVWTCQMVGRLTHNPILKGVRVRNNRKSKRVNKTGKRITVKAPPEERLERNCPHLAFIEPARYDRVVRMLQQRNAIYKPGGANGPHPCEGRPRKRTIWPGQHIYCGVCGRLYRYGGHGQNDHLLCRGAYEYFCWNGVTVDGPQAAHKLSTAILAEIEALPDFDAVFHEMARQEIEQANSSRSDRLSEVARQLAQVQREIDNLLRFIVAAKWSESTGEELQRLEAKRGALVQQQEAIEKEPTNACLLPGIDALKDLARQQIALQAGDPYAFGRVMHELIDKIVVFPYRLLDGGAVVLRAKFHLSLTSLLPPSQQLGGLEEVLRRQLTVDLFDPVQREEYRLRVMAMTAEGKLTQREMAAQLGITLPPVQRALALARTMERESLVDPYAPVTAPLEDMVKLRRHKHPRYKFDPLPSAGSF